MSSSNKEMLPRYPMGGKDAKENKEESGGVMHRGTMGESLSPLEGFSCRTNRHSKSVVRDCEVENFCFPRYPASVLGIKGKHCGMEEQRETLKPRYPQGCVAVERGYCGMLRQQGNSDSRYHMPR